MNTYIFVITPLAYLIVIAPTYRFYFTMTLFILVHSLMATMFPNPFWIYLTQLFYLFIFKRNGLIWIGVQPTDLWNQMIRFYYTYVLSFVTLVSRMIFEFIQLCFEFTVLHWNIYFELIFDSYQSYTCTKFWSWY